MKTYYHSYIKKFQFIPKSRLYDEDSKSTISEFNKHEATLYCIVKTPKIVFLPETFSVDKNYNLIGKVKIGNDNIKEIKFNAVEILYQLPQLKENFSTLEIFCDTYMNLYNELPLLSNNLKYNKLSSIDINNSNESIIRLNCPIVKAITKGKGLYSDLRIYQLINYFNIDILEDLEVQYIGKSNDNTWNRLYNHNKWGLLEEHRDKREEDYLVYFLQLEDIKINISGRDNLSTIHKDNNINLVDATKITEASLINYFIKNKKFNKEMVDIDLAKWDFIKKKLSDNGYTDVVVELYLDGLFGNLGTIDIGYKSYHQIEYKI